MAFSRALENNLEKPYLDNASPLDWYGGQLLKVKRGFDFKMISRRGNTKRGPHPPRVNGKPLDRGT